MELAGKVALVTGGSRGIGAAVARRLAGDGAAVALTYANAADKAAEVARHIEDKGGRALVIQADHADPGTAADAVEQTVDQLGRLDILVNNAGIFTGGPLEETTGQDLDRILDIDVKAVFLASLAAARHMSDGGRIITIGSVNSDRMPFVGGSVYALTKGAVASFTKGLARDLGERKITVNNIQPGPVDTEANPASGPFSEVMLGLLAMKRYGHADEIAAMTAYLAGPEAGYITGASLLIDGGFAA